MYAVIVPIKLLLAVLFRISIISNACGSAVIAYINIEIILVCPFIFSDANWEKIETCVWIVDNDGYNAKIISQII